MSNGRLKASTNRVRTSVALQQTSIWTTAIGMEKHENTNSVIEATLNAPGMLGGGAVGSKRGEARRAAAAAAVEAAGGFGGEAVDNYQGLLDLARSQGALGGLNRGACKKCGQLGHLTKQCRNHFSRFFDGGPGDEKDAAVRAAAAAGVPTAAIALAPLSNDAGPENSGSSSDSLEDLAAGSDSDSSSSDDSAAARRRRKEKERKKKRKQKEKEKKRRREKKARKESKSDKRHSRQRRSPVSSDS